MDKNQNKDIFPGDTRGSVWLYALFLIITFILLGIFG